MNEGKQGGPQAGGDGGEAYKCGQLHDLAPELVLGTASAAERSVALRHLRGCPDRRREVRELTETADELLLAAPVADPPPGFEARVLGALEPPARPPRSTPPTVARRIGRRTALLVAAASLLVALSVSALGLRPGVGQPSTVARPTMAAAFTDPSGSEVGAALLMAGPRPYLTVSVTAVDARAYRVMVDRVDAPSQEVGIAPAAGGACTWARMLPLPYGSVRAVRLVPTEGGPGYTSHLRS